MFKMPVYEYSYKVGSVLVLLAFLVGLFGNKDPKAGIEFSFSYYQYLFTLIIVFAGIQYGVLAAFFTSTSICILHVMGITVNPVYYSSNSVIANYNIQLIYFTLLALISGFGNELMSKHCLSLTRTISELTKKAQSASPAAAQAQAGGELYQAQKVDTSVKYYNFLLRFSRTLASCKSLEDVHEALVKSLAVDFGIKECAVFTVTERGRRLAGKSKKNLQHIEKIEEVEINFGEGLIGKAAVTGQMMTNLDANEKNNEWQMALPLAAHGSTRDVVAVAKFRNIGLLSPEDVQYIGRIAEICSTATEQYIPREAPAEHQKAAPNA